MLFAGYSSHQAHDRAANTAAEAENAGVSRGAPQQILMQQRRPTDPTMLYHTPLPTMRDAARPGISPTELW